jgi:DNA-binding transcriptional regulator YhcF (GntR family)
MNLYLTKPTPPEASSRPLWQIDESNRTPKFLQLVNGVIAGIERGVLKPGDRLPSINETSVEYLLARATVEKAYGLLQEMGHVASLQRKGYFIQGQRMARRVMLLVGQLTPTTEQLGRDLGQTLGAGYKVDVFVHAYKKAYFCETLENQLERYHAFVIHPQHIEPCERVKRMLNKIPQDRLVWLGGSASCVVPGAWSELDSTQLAQPTKHETTLAALLQAHPDLFGSYRAVRLVTSDEEYVPADWLREVETYCTDRRLEYHALDGFEDEVVQVGTAYLVFDDQDLVRILKQIQERGWQPGREVGILSYQDQPYKEILAGGLSTFGPDTRQVARQVAEQLSRGQRQAVSLALRLQKRASL